MEKNIDWKSLYITPFKSCKNTKLQWFQYRINQRIIATNDLLFKIKLRDNNLCSFCNNAAEKIEHLFWYCEVINNFWIEIEEFIFMKINKYINIYRESAIFGLTNKKEIYVPQNFLLLTTRYYIYKCRIDKRIPDLDSWKTSLKYQFEIEKIIAIKNNIYAKFIDFWDPWINIFD